MSTPQMNEYVKQRLAVGIAPADIQAELVRAGWSASDAAAAVGAPSAAAPPSKAPAASGGGGKKIAVIALVALLVAGGGVGAYLAFFRPSPEAVLAVAVANLQATKSGEAEGSVRLEGEAPDVGGLLGGGLSRGDQPSMKPATIQLTFTSATDFTDAANRKASVTLTFATTEALAGLPIASINLRTFGKKTYVSVSSPLGPLGSISDQWVKIDQEALRGLAAMKSGAAAPEASAEPAKELTEAQIQAIGKAFRASGAVKVTEVLPSEDVAGQASFHYKLAVDKEALKKFVMELKNILDDKASLAYEKLASDLDEYDEKVSISSFEVWIAKKTKRFTRVKLALEGVPDEKSSFALKTATLDVTLKSQGQPVTIEEPSDAKSLEEVIPALLFGAMGGAGELSGEGDAADGSFSLEAPSSKPLRKEDVVIAMRIIQEYHQKSGAYPETLIGLMPGDLANNESLSYAVERGSAGFRLNATYSLGEDGSGFRGFTERDFLPISDSAFDDQDGLSGFDEFLYGTDDRKADTDGDGFNDGDEVKNGYNPNGPGKL